MIYPYRCSNCNHEFTVTKRVADIDSAEACPQCAGATERQLATRFFFSGTDEKTEYYHAFGQYVTSRKQKKELMRKYNVEEVGNEDVESLHKRSETVIEEKCAKRWAEV